MSEFFRIDPRHVQAAISMLEGNHKLFARWLTETRTHAPEIIKMPKKWLNEARGTIRHPEQNVEEEERKTAHLVSLVVCALWLAHGKTYPQLGEALLDGVMKEPTPYTDLERELRESSVELSNIVEQYTTSLGVSLAGRCIAVVLAVAFIRSVKGVSEPIAEGDEALAVAEAVRFLQERSKNA